MSDYQQLEAQYLMATSKRLPVTLVRGQGVRVWDDAGREYLDFVGGIAVNILGHCHPVVLAALREQGERLMQTSNLFYTVPQIELARLLVEQSCLDKVFFCNSGAEANEGAVKLARKYGKLHLNGAYEVISALDSFHGRTLAMVAATGQRRLQEPYTPLPDGFINVPFNDIEAIKGATTADTCAIIMEPIQGEGGVNIPSADYLRQVRSWCDQKGLLLILDEVQTGLGRTGTLFGYQLFGVEPDIITLAKGLGGGFPIGAILAKEGASVFAPGDHGSTLGGNPLACAAGYATLKFLLEKGVVENSKRVGEHLMAKLKRLATQFDHISEVRGCGLLAALQFDQDSADEVVLACLEQGLLLNAVKPNALRFMPPLIVTEEEVDAAIAILEEVLRQRWS